MQFFREDNLKELYFVKGVKVKPSPIHGLGVFATEDMPAHYCFEICPLIKFNKRILIDHMELTEEFHILQEYVFKCPDGLVGIALGYGSIYNHSSNPNALWRLRKNEFPGVEFFTMKPIKSGEEICTRYRPDSRELYFLDESEHKRLGIDS